jgi:vacuolar-type H+-ATPase subunit H
MAHTVQSFIDTLRTDGVGAGRKAAEEIRREAERQSQQLIQDAQAQAARIVEEAEQERRKALERTRIELAFAARDTMARLRDSLNQAIRRVLEHAASKALDDAEFLQDLIKDVVRAYVQSDATQDRTLEVNVSAPMQQKLADWAIAALRKSGLDDQLAFELRGALSTAGFEYKLSGGTVEVTPAAVVQLLSPIVTPKLQELLVSCQQEQDSE